TIAPADMLDTTTNLSARVAFVADDVLVRGDELAMLPLPTVGARVGMINFIIGKTGLEERRFPLQSGDACGVRERIELTLSDQFDTPVAIPVTEPVVTNALSWRLDMRQVGRHLTADGEFRLEVSEFSPPAYQDLKATLRHMETALRKMPAYRLERGSAGDSDAIVASESITLDVQPSGEWVETRTIRKRILTYAGVKQHGELKLTFNSAWETVELLNASVTAPDGTTNTISAGEINVMDAPWVGSAKRYPPQQTLVASFPAVSVGSVITYTYRRTYREHPFVSGRESFRDFNAITEKTLSLTTPAATALAIHAHDASAVSISNAAALDGAQIRSWHVSAMPAVAHEDDLPPSWWLHPTITWSTGSWPDYARDLHDRLVQAASGQRQAEALARDLARQADDWWDTLKAIRDAVALRVREVGPALPDVPLSTITPADRTLNDGYGNTTDRAVLLYAMARAAGFKPEFVVASGRPAIESFRQSLEDAPLQDVFSRVLVRVWHKRLGIAANHYVYLGDTDQYAAIGASTHARNWALELPGGAITAIEPARENRKETDYAIRLSPNGDAVMMVTRRYYGEAFGQENRRFAEMRPEERDRYFQELVADLAQSAEPVSVLTTDFSGYPGWVRFSVRIPSYAVCDGNLMYLTLPTSLERLLTLRADTRSLPLFLASERHDQETLTILYPDGYEPVALPPEVRVQDLAGLDASVHVDDGQLGGQLTSPDEARHRSLVITFDTTQVPSIVPTSDYPALLRMDRDLSHQRARMVVLEKRP
ncbi:MAG: DUF3857 and transglutaminase domain-containing protein, partial [Verrucomicrobia bacterium]|nr:DUF3857 and transglutaminase domain-containing protein [Verrucomicrobiota bacterium]